MEKDLIEEREYSNVEFPQFQFLQLLEWFERNDSDNEYFLAMSKWVEDNDDKAEPDWDEYWEFLDELYCIYYDAIGSLRTVNTMRLNRNWALYKDIAQ